MINCATGMINRFHLQLDLTSSAKSFQEILLFSLNLLKVILYILSE